MEETENLSIKDILEGDDKSAIRALFSFSKDDSDAEVLLKYNLWCRYCFPKYFKSDDAPFHREMDQDLLDIYRGRIKTYTSIVFRGGAKTSRTKLFIAFVILNDKDHLRRYFKVLTKDLGNSKQMVTDVYNMFVDLRVQRIYPETFQKTSAKREETMGSFTTSTGIKIIADTVGTDQRGQIQEASRPDFIIMDDFETRKTLYSASETMKIWDNMNEAITGLSRDGGAVFLCNYISERGNVHKLIQKKNENNRVRIIPIRNKAGKSNWNFYSDEEIKRLEKEAEDFFGEYMCEPSASLDVMFDRATLDRMEPKLPIQDIAGLKIFREFNPSHRYASGHDVGGGVGLDSSSSVFIDFDCLPAQVVATYASNTIKPDIFGDEIKRQAEKFGESFVAVERNKYDMVLLRLRQIYPENRIYKTSKESVRVANSMETEFGWLTTSLSKPKMFFELAKAVEDGLLVLNDEGLIAEAKSYSRDDIMDKASIDPRMTTRHFDLLTACAIAWQMRNHVEYPKRIAEEENRYARNRAQRMSGADLGL
ncbi:MAG: hypothetical protein WC346_01355 [Methanogenium sp.]|jgi:hypothetical protein